MNLERISSSTFLPLSQDDAREVLGGQAAQAVPILQYTDKCGVRGPDGQLAVISDYE